ncbi:MAG: argininosuccinate synthase, partial [Methanomicrobiaceae archaeon]|nr:argininosuccinate synthase [Methanomicrobiaceae archaeon]
MNRFTFAMVMMLCIVLFAAPAAAATTEVHVVKYANDGTTVLAETTVDYTWMEANLPVYGDGVTHYY